MARNGEHRRAAALLAIRHPEDVSRVLERLPFREAFQIYRYLPLEIQAEVLIRLDEETLDKILRHLSNQDLSELVEELDPDDATDLLQELPEEERHEVLAQVPAAERREMEELLHYPEDTAGGLMTTEYLAFPATARVREVLEAIRRAPEELGEETGFVYVVDEGGRLIGQVPLPALIRADEEAPLSELVEEVTAVPVDMDQEDVARLFEKYDLLSLPVVDAEGRLVGVITADDVLDVIEEEASEDIAKLAGLGEMESPFSPPLRSASRRLPWLLVNLLTAFLAASVVGIFKDTIAAWVSLAVFMPVIAGMGGNAGVQTIALIVRALALGLVEFQDVKRLLLREITVGLIIGVVVGLVTAIVAYFWDQDPWLGGLVFVALLLNMVAACVAGTLVPLVLKVLGRDPALASGVIVTTVTDVTGYFIFLGLATALLTLLR